MNSVNLIGNICKDLELKIAGEHKVLRFSIGVARMKKGEADFVNCIAWDKTAEIIQKFFSKGKKIGISGRLNTGSYEKDGKKVYTTDVIVDNITFCEAGKKEEKTEEEKIDDEFPF